MNRARALAARAALLLLAACGATPTTAATPPSPPAAPAAAASAPSASPTDFTGLWRTTYGSMRLVQVGTHVSGSYSYNEGSHVEGEVDGRSLRAGYTEPDGVAGRAIFELAADGSSFRGRWRADATRPIELSDADANDWDGERAQAVPGRTWLVILEAPWETSLNDAPYSYGEMLEAFFARVPDVEVRHVFVHDRADFVRACRAVGELVGPVVLYVSSHGGPDGVHAGPDTIDGRTIGEALRETGDLRLLHLGACGVMGGEAAAEIRAAAAPHATFPISGFTVTVDWAGSAIVDFTYMSLVLEQDLDPVAAVAATRAMLSFAGPGREGDALDGTDLTVFAP